MISFNRDICCNVGKSAAREWLVTNGIGGYASGTVSGILTRRYHGLLIAALKPPMGRTLMLAKIDEVATYGSGMYALGVNRWRYGHVEPDGYRWLGQFHLEGTTPVWMYPLGNARLEKRVWMQPGANTTYVSYVLLGGHLPVTLELKTSVNYRGHHNNTHAEDWQMDIQPVDAGLQITAHAKSVPLFLRCPGALVEAQHIWMRDFYLSVEEYRGYDALDDNLYAARFEVTLNPGESRAVVASIQPDADLDFTAAYTQRQDYEAALIAQAGAPSDVRVQHLVLAADQFIVQRTLPHTSEGRSVIAGYQWFADWGRDAMIGLPGLTLATGRPALARQILRTYKYFVDQGMLPNHFMDTDALPTYNTIDATLWYFEVARAYYEATQDLDLIRELFPVFQDIVAWHQRGTRYQIHVDPADGLLYAGEPGVQLTWMDAKFGDWVVTPRMGKPVEINALWYNALCVMASFAELLGESAAPYTVAAEQIHQNFARFWNVERGYCFDVLDGPEGNDPALRPNQLFAVALPFSPLPPAQQRTVVDVCAQNLLTPRGLRSLGRDEPAYIGRYGGDVGTRDAAYHQGTTWGWLLGMFALAHLRVYQDPVQAQAYLEPLFQNLTEHGVGSLSEIFDGDAPFTPRGCIAQAWTVAQFLWAQHLIQQFAAK